jgi:hypothetical protein
MAYREYYLLTVSMPNCFGCTPKTSTVLRIFGWLWIMTLVFSCTMSEPQTATITVKYGDDYYSRSGSEAFTLGALHDTGIGLDTLWLRPDAPGTWKLSVNELTRGLHRPSDTLHFRFFLADEASDRKTGSLLKKEKEMRSVSLSDLLDENVVMEFGQPWQPGQLYKVTFQVDMNNQKVLGFFRPDEGDRVAVSGSWCGWCRPGVILEPSGNGIWQNTVRFSAKPGNAEQYRFSIQTERDVIMPAGGVETVRRQIKLTENPEEVSSDHPQEFHAGLAFYNNQRRVVRFIAESDGVDIKESHGGQNVMQNKADYYVHIWYENLPAPERSEPMMRVSDQRWEMVFMVPPGVDTLGWAVTNGQARAVKPIAKHRVLEEGSAVYKQF